MTYKKDTPFFIIGHSLYSINSNVISLLNLAHGTKYYNDVLAVQEVIGNKRNTIVSTGKGLAFPSYFFVESQFHTKNILVDQVTQFNASCIKISKILCYTFDVKVFQQTFSLSPDAWKIFMPSKMTKHLKNMKEWSRIKITCPLVWVNQQCEADNHW